jgi:hypothetical protein
MPPAKPPESNPSHSLVIADGEIVVALDCEPLLDAKGPLPMVGVLHRHFSELGADLLAELKPHRIIVPLFATGYDAMAAIEVLEQLKFAGQITVIAPELPRPRLVERELRAQGPGARLSLISP